MYVPGTQLWYNYHLQIQFSPIEMNFIYCNEALAYRNVAHFAFLIENIGNKTSRIRVLNDGPPQWSVLFSFLFLYTREIPISRKCMFTDDNALAYQPKSFREFESVLNENLEMLADFISKAGGYVPTPHRKNSFELWTVVKRIIKSKFISTTMQ